jgi:hypothetical protein
MTRLLRRQRIQDRPPERFHAFMSYTTREDEVREIKPVVDRFLNDYLRPSIQAALGEPPIFYDGWYLRNPPTAICNEYLLQRALRFAIEESEMLLAFVSPLYVQSPWCMFEVETMARKAPRPWYDICRKVPNDELLDRRQSHMRPSNWECLIAALARRIGQARAPHHVESPIITIVWKGESGLRTRLPLSLGRHAFDWRGCGRCVEWEARIARHRWRHGSVSPSWEAEAAAELQGCEEAMSSTAKAVVKVLKDRREAYRKSAWRGQRGGNRNEERM